MRFGFVVALIMGVLPLSVQAVESVPDRGQAVVTSIAREVQRAGELEQKLNLKNAAPFAWDRVFFFGPYTPVATVAAQLNIVESAVPSRRIENNAGLVLMAFMASGRLVQFVEMPRALGDFSGLDNPAGYARTEASFVVTPNPDVPNWYTVEIPAAPVPPAATAATAVTAGSQPTTAQPPTDAGKTDVKLAPAPIKGRP